MEIFDFLHLSIRRIVALALLAALVALPTAALLLRGPSQYRATVSVRMAPFIPTNAGSGVRAQIENDFYAALGVPSVERAIASQAKVSESAVRRRLVITLPSQGTTLNLSFTDQQQERALTVVQIAATKALVFLAQQQVDQTTAALVVADRGISTALANLEHFDATSGDGSLNGRLSLLTQQVLSLGDQVSLARTLVDATQAARLLDQTTAELNHLEAQAPIYGRLADQFGQAVGGAQDATANDTAARSALAAAASGSAVSPYRVAVVGKLRRTVLFGFGAGLVAVIAAVAILALEELRRRTLPSSMAHGPARLDEKPLVELAGESLLERLLSSQWTTRWLILLVPVGVLVGTALITLMGQSRATLAFVLAAPVGLIAAILAITNFERFLFTMVIVRSSLDSLNIQGAGGGVDPGVAVGGVFIIAGLLWLGAQRRAGLWVPASRTTRALWIFAAACALSVPTSMRITGSAIATTKVIAGVLMFSVLEQYLGRRPQRVRPLIVCFFLALVVPAGVGLRQLLTHHGNTYTADVSRVTGTFVHPSNFADFLVLTLPLAALLTVYYRGWLRVATGSALLASGTLLVFTYTREAWLAAIVSLGCLGIRARREVLYGLVAAVLLLAVAVPSVSSRLADLHGAAPGPGVPINSLSWRVGYWQQLIPMAGRNPVTGIGFDAVQRVTAEQLQPHNAFVEAYVETGLVGLGALLYVIWCLAGDLRRRLRSATAGWERLLALAAVAAAMGLLAAFPGENLLTQTAVYWYAAVAMTFGFGARGVIQPGKSRRYDPNAVVQTPIRNLVSVE